MPPSLAQLAEALAADAPNHKERWNRMFEAPEPFYVDRPNAWLVECVRGVPPGRALEIGAGQGRNAVWLAQQGWRVTAVDISDTAAEQMRRRAADAGVEIETALCAAADFDFGTERWDLVAAIYVHGIATAAASRICASLRRGGLLAVEGFHRDIEKNAGRTLGIRTNELLRKFDALRILRYEDRLAPADWSRGETNPIVRMLARRE